MDEVTTVAQANQMWSKLSPSERDVVKATYARTKDAIHAMNIALSQRGQDTARTAVDAANDLREPSVSEKASSFAQGAADTLGMGLAPLAKGAAQAFLLPGIGAKDAFVQGYDEQRARQQSADEQAPAAAGAGHLTGDAINAALAAAAPVKSGVQAAVDIANGAKPMALTADKGAIALMSPSTAKVLGSAGKAVSTRFDSLPGVVRAGLAVTTGGTSEVGGAIAKALSKLVPEAVTSYGGEAAPAARQGLGDIVDAYLGKKPGVSPVPDVEEVVAPVAEDAGTPPSMLSPASKTPDWHFNPAESPPPAVQAELDALASRVRGGGTTPLPQTGSMRATPKPAAMRDVARDVVATEHPEDFAEGDPDLREAARALIESELAKGAR